MIGIDVGSSLIKWFDGENFGTGMPPLRGVINVGISSFRTLVKVGEYPVCSASGLEKIIRNETEVEIGIDPADIGIACCIFGKEKEKCRVVAFIEKKSDLENIDRNIYTRAKLLTVDIAGMIVATLKIYGNLDVTVVDAGKSKISVLKLTGKNVGVSVIRAGFHDVLEDKNIREKFLSAIGNEVVLTGGGSHNKQFIDILSSSGVYFDIPVKEPFGRIFPLYYNSYGLFNLHRSICKFDFKKTGVFTSEFFSKYSKEAKLAFASLAASAFFLTSGEVVKLYALKREYNFLKLCICKAVSDIVKDKKIVAPFEQLINEKTNVKKKADFFMINTPSILQALNALSSSVVKGIKINSVKISSGGKLAIVISGYANNQGSINKFRKLLKEHFQNVSLSLLKTSGSRVKFSINVSGSIVEN